MPPRNAPPLWLTVAAGCAALALLAGGIVLALSMKPRAASGVQTVATRTTGAVEIGGPFTLVDQDGEVFTDADLLGKPSLIYFGYTFCPDVCPLGLQMMGAALERLPEAERANVQPVFVTVDSARDTPERLRQYVTTPGFPEGLIALTGTEDQAREARDAYKIYAAKGEEAGDFYLVDHASVIYLMDADGEFLAAFSHSESPQAVAETIEALT